MLHKLRKKTLAFYLNTFLIPITFTIFICFWVGFIRALTNGSGIGLLATSLILNYIITLSASIYLFSITKKSDLFINFFLFLFIFLPFIGIFLYFLLGSSLIIFSHSEYYLKKVKKYQKYENYDYSKKLKKGSNQKLPNKTFLYNYIKHNVPIYGNNHFRVLSDPSQILGTIIDLINKAEKFIHLEYYIFSDGLVVNYLVDLLARKAKEGVEVRLIVDYTANYRRLSKETIMKIKKAGIYFKVFNPLFRSNNMWWQFRDHNKLIVADNKYGMYGSCNLADENFNISDFYFQSTELCVYLEGPVVNSLNILFCIHWEMSWSKYLMHEEQAIYLDTSSYLRIFKSDKSDIPAQFLSSAPVLRHTTIKDNLVHLIFNAEKSITISTPYFYPPKEIINALKQASISGVKIRILVPNQSDLKNFLRNLNFRLFLDLLPENIEIYEYYGFNHEKLMIIDDETAYFGSYNWDYRALYLNFEGALLVKSKEMVRDMKKFIDNQLKNSQKILYSEVLFYKNIKFTISNTIIKIFKPFL